MTPAAADALLILSFGGPEGLDEVLPFLRRVTAGRGIPDARLKAVGSHYNAFAGVSPLPAATRRLADDLRARLGRPVFLGNLYTAPFVSDAVAAMVTAGVARADVLLTSLFGSPPGCERYRDALVAALDAAGEAAPEVARLPLLHDDDGFLEASASRVRDARARLPEARLVFVAHSLPESVARACPYEAQLQAAASRIADAVDAPDFDLVWQSRSGPPKQPWLEPDVSEHLGVLADDGVRRVVFVPLGFPLDNIEISWDLDLEAGMVAESLGIEVARAGTPGTHPAFLAAIARQIDAPRRLPSACGAQCCGLS